jgi:ABC-type lipoprotein release transport system permease subunit
MRRNVFLVSVLRQPVRTLVLAVLIGVAAFAFIARAAEYIIVSNEIDRIEAFSRSIGVFSPIDPQNFTEGHDVTYAAAVVAASPHVAFEDRRVFTQGVFSDRQNLVAIKTPFSYRFPYSFLVPHYEDMGIKVMDHYFYAIAVTTPRLVLFGEQHYMIVTLDVDGHLVGDPRALRDTDIVFVPERGQAVSLTSREQFRLPITPQEAELYSQGLFNPLGGVEFGGRYLFRANVHGVPDPYNPRRWHLRPLGGDDGVRRVMVPRPGAHLSYMEAHAIVPELRGENLVFYVATDDTAAYHAMIERISDDLALLAENLSSVTVVGTADMSAIPRFQSPIHARLLRVDGGRWLDHNDHVNANPVAVMPVNLAIRNNLQVGETFTITLRDNPRPDWIDRETTSGWSRGIEGWWDSAYHGWWGLTSYENWRELPTFELELEVVGVYMFSPPVGSVHNFSANEIFIPASLIPEGFGWDDAPLLTGMYSFVLNSPRHEEAFINQNSEAFAAMGFEVAFLPNDFEFFQNAVAPIRTSLTINLVAFSIVSILILALVIFGYIRQWSKSLAIVRALGLPTGVAMRRFFAPVLYIWLPAIAIGAVVAWFFALYQAQNSLAAFGGEIGYADVGIGIFFALLIGTALLATLGVGIGGARLARRPVLEQLQGVVQKRQKTTVPDSVPVGEITLKKVEPKRLATSRRKALSTAFRHMRRRILRAPVKSALAVLLALFFALSLGWINHTIIFNEGEVERLFNTTIITADIVRATDGHPMFENAPIRQDVLDQVLYSGFVQDAYVEGVWFWGNIDHTLYSTLLGVSCIEGFVENNTLTPLDAQIGVEGESLEITFAEGFGMIDFILGEGRPIPVVVRYSALEVLEVGLGDAVSINDTAMPWVLIDGEWVQETHRHVAQAQIVGYFTGGISRAVNSMDDIHAVVPEQFLRNEFSEHWTLEPEGWGIGALTYKTARLYLDPARNRELSRLPELMTTQLAGNHLGRNFGAFPLEILIHDELLRIVIEPMERNVAFLRVLYPLSIAAAVVLGLGLSLLTMLHNAKNAAIMRILGASRRTTRFALGVEQVLICIIGVIVGLVVLFAMGASVSITPFMLAAVYFTSALLGTAVGTFVISMRAPLDLLQVRE